MRFSYANHDRNKNGSCARVPQEISNGFSLKTVGRVTCDTTGGKKSGSVSEIAPFGLYAAAKLWQDSREEALLIHTRTHGAEPARAFKS
jgi:hypothetical protein